MSWLERIRKEQVERQAREQAERDERARRLKRLLDSDSEDNEEEKIDYKGLVGDNLKSFLERIESHVMAENKILSAWNDKDGGAEAAGKDGKKNS